MEGLVLVKTATLTLLATVLVGLAHASPSPDVEPPTGWLGLGFVCERDADTKEWFLRVVGTAPGGPASDAGLEPQDLIVEIDGEPMECRDQLASLELFREVRPGQVVRFRVLRAGKAAEHVVRAVGMSPEHARLWIHQYQKAWQERMSREGDAGST